MGDKLQDSNAEAVATNTLIITNVSPQCFENHGELIKKLLEPYGHLEKLIVLKSFGRLLAVFDDTFISQKIKHELHKTKFEGKLNFIWENDHLTCRYVIIKTGKEIRVYFGMHTDLNWLNPEPSIRMNYLNIPEPERNFLLSPPGSPPVGWLQTAESEPKPGGFCETIQERALSFVSLNDFKLDGYEDLDLSRETARDRKFEGTGQVKLPVLQIDTVPDMFDTTLPMPTTSRPPIKDE
ncbi:carbohydrate-binding module 1 protein [Boothiomyces sp. JEL0838]|nr:carbohydrate-binding module 1 protein [Boothiomyces sp. JEL0838]